MDDSQRQIVDTQVRAPESLILGRNGHHEVFGQLPLFERKVYPDEERSIAVCSNIKDVLDATPNGSEGIDGAGAYDGRGMYFIVPREGQTVRYLMDPLCNFGAEVGYYQTMLEAAGIPSEEFQPFVMTATGVVHYSELPEDYVPDEMSAEQRREHLFNFAGDDRLHLMMATPDIAGIPHQELVESGIRLGDSTVGLDKAVGKYILTRNGTERAVAPGNVIMNPKRFREAQQLFPGIDWGDYCEIGTPHDCSYAHVLREDDPDGNFQDVWTLVWSNYDNLGQIVLKHGTGHSGTSNFFMTDREQLDPDRLAEYLQEALSNGENLVIEQAIDMMRDGDGEVELGVRGYSREDDSTLVTSLHRQITDDHGVYEGEILAVDGANLTTNPDFAVAAASAYESFFGIADAYAACGYEDGPLNIDFVISNDAEPQAYAVDLNNLREGGSSASSNVLSIAHQSVLAGNQPVMVSHFTEVDGFDVPGFKMISTLSSGETVSAENLGLYDRDYSLSGELPVGVSWDVVIKRLQSTGVIPYSTSTLRLNANGNGARKLKLMSLFDFEAVREEVTGRSDRFGYVDAVVMERVNDALSEFGMSVTHSH